MTLALGGIGLMRVWVPLFIAVVHESCGLEWRECGSRRSFWAVTSWAGMVILRKLTGLCRCSQK
jgi:hypothetical protein